MDTIGLQLFFQQNNLYMRALTGLNNYLSNWKHEDPQDFNDVINTVSVDDLVPKLSKVSLVINYNFDTPIEYVQVLIDIYLEEELKATYSFLVTSDGNDMDDSIL